MLTCIILCKGFSRGSRLMQRFLPGFLALGCSGLCKTPLNPGSRAYQFFQTLPSSSYSLHRLSAILASKDFFTVMASSGHIS